MKTRQRALIKWLFCGLAGAACAAPEAPAYYNFFASPVRLDRYLRNMQAMERIQTVTEPTLHGAQSLEMQFRFTDKRLQGSLRWDLAPVAFSRIRFSIYNPNPGRHKIFLNIRFADTEKRMWRLSSGNQPLKPKEWTVIDAVLADKFTVTQGKDPVKPAGLKPAFDYFDLDFSVQKDFSALDEPILLYLDGFEAL
jgi:hypothetical protein